jgi:hypothetical protein
MRNFPELLFLGGNSLTYDSLFIAKPNGDVYTVNNYGTDSVNQTLLFRTRVPVGTTWVVHGDPGVIGELWSWGETVWTGAGIFSNCIHIHISNYGILDDYWLAPGIGVVAQYEWAFASTSSNPSYIDASYIHVRGYR